MHQLGFVFGSFGIDPQISFPSMSEPKSFFAGVLVPSDFGGDKGTCDHVDFSVAVNIEGEITVALDVPIPVIDVSQRSRNERRARIPVTACDDIELGVSVNVGDRTQRFLCKPEGLEGTNCTDKRERKERGSMNFHLVGQGVE
jgi:hypothetical protein